MAFGAMLVIFFFTQIARNFSADKGLGAQKRTTENVPQAAGFPEIGDSVFLPETPSSPFFLPKSSVGGLFSPQTGPTIPRNTPFDILDSISQIIGPTSIVPLPIKETLPLPHISAGEFPVGTGGAKTITEYMTQVAINGSRVSLTKKEFDQLLKWADRRILLPQELIELALLENSFSKIQNSLRVFLNLYAKQDALLTSIPVSSPGIKIAEQMIGIERLTVLLMRHATEVSAGTMSEKEFNDFYEKYKNTSRAVRDALVENPSSRESRSLAGHIERSRERLSGIFSLFIPSALAQMGAGAQPFGGDIDEVNSDNCYCSGQEVTLKENYVQGGATDFLYPYSVIASGTYKNRAVQQDTCVLGTYSQSGTCVSGDECEDSETEDGTISLIGTSQSGSECSSNSSGSGGSTGGGSSGSGF